MRSLLAILLLMAPAMVTASPDGPNGPGAPEIVNGPDPAGVVYVSLSPEARGEVDARRIHCLPMRSERDGGLTLHIRCIGVLDAPPPRVEAALRGTSNYGRWLSLNPGYKSVSAEGRKLLIGVGKSDREKVKAQLRYDISFRESGMQAWSVEWALRNEARNLRPGSFYRMTVAPHPENPKRSLILHTQELRSKGMIANRYLLRKKDDGHTQAWRDARKHVRRVHWALAVEVAGLAGDEARRAYARHYLREFGRTPPGDFPSREDLSRN
jgi:hypothetical protein